VDDPAPLPHQRLRGATQASHDRVDAAYGRFDLGDRSSYGAFLLAHARVLPAIEAVLAGSEHLSPIDPRTPLLDRDLADLGLARPTPMVVALPVSAAAAWAMLYVVEGSRLGGVMLARSVGPGLPRAYLSAGHARGGWRNLLAALDAAAQDDEWMDEAIPTARAVFDLYAVAAEQDGG